MIKPDELKVGLLVWWTAERTMSSWNCPGVITEVDKASNRFRVRTFDTMQETKGLLIDRPAGGDESSLNEMEVTTENKIFDYLRENEASFQKRVLEQQVALENLKAEYGDYHKSANILRAELQKTVPKGIMPK